MAKIWYLQIRTGKFTRGETSGRTHLRGVFDVQPALIFTAGNPLVSNCIC